MWRLLIIGAVAIIPALASRAQTPDHAHAQWRGGLTSGLACEAAAQNAGTLDQALCYRDELARQDQRLNRIWRRLSPDRRNRLRDGERNWIRQRDQICRDEAADTINTTAAYVTNRCMVKETIRRMIWLQNGR